MKFFSSLFVAAAALIGTQAVPTEEMMHIKGKYWICGDSKPYWFEAKPNMCTSLKKSGKICGLWVPDGVWCSGYMDDKCWKTAMGDWDSMMWVEAIKCWKKMMD